MASVPLYQEHIWQRIFREILFPDLRWTCESGLDRHRGGLSGGSLRKRGNRQRGILR
jgi:hypothetical protein